MELGGYMQNNISVFRQNTEFSRAPRDQDPRSFLRRFVNPKD